MERVLNVNNNDVGSSIRKSLSRNMGGQYAVELKSSIKEIPVSSAAVVDEIKFQISETQQAIKTIRFDIIQLKEDIRNKTMLS